MSSELEGKYSGMSYKNAPNYGGTGSNYSG